MASVIRLKRKSSTSTNDNITLREGEPLYDLKKKALYVGNQENELVTNKKHLAQITNEGNSGTDKVQFYIGENSDNKYTQTINNVNNAVNADVANNVANLSLSTSSGSNIVLKWGPNSEYQTRFQISGADIGGTVTSAKNVTETIAGTPLSDIFESDGSTVKKISERAIEGIQFNATSNIHHYFICSTDPNIATKTVQAYSISDSDESNVAVFNQEPGARVFIKFENGDTSKNPQLNINNTGVKPIYYNGNRITTSNFESNHIYEFIFAHGAYNLITPTLATSIDEGLIKIGYQKPPAESNNYQPVQLDSNGKAYVHITGSIDGEAIIPWH